MQRFLTGLQLNTTFMHGCMLANMSMALAVCFRGGWLDLLQQTVDVLSELQRVYPITAVLSEAGRRLISRMHGTWASGATSSRVDSSTLAHVQAIGVSGTVFTAIDAASLPSEQLESNWFDEQLGDLPSLSGGDE